MMNSPGQGVSAHRWSLLKPPHADSHSARWSIDLTAQLTQSILARSPPFFSFASSLNTFVTIESLENRSSGSVWFGLHASSVVTGFQRCLSVLLRTERVVEVWSQEAGKVSIFLCICLLVELGQIDLSAFINRAAFFKKIEFCLFSLHFYWLDGCTDGRMDPHVLVYASLTPLAFSQWVFFLLFSLGIQCASISLAYIKLSEL